MLHPASKLKQLKQLVYPFAVALLFGSISLSQPGLTQAPPTEETPQTNPMPSLLEDGYVLGAGDRIRLDILSVADYNGEYQVLSDGSINLPLAGTVLVQGLTIKQATEDITARYGRLLRLPMLTIALASARPVRVAIAGEVNRPGSYALTGSPSVAPSTPTGATVSGTNATSPSNTGNAIPTITSVIQLAGGITQLADIRHIQIRRMQNRIIHTDRILNVDLWQLLQAADSSQDVILRDGDRIVVPTAATMDPSEVTRLASASFSPSTIIVNVVGEVTKPGAISVPPNTPLNQVLLAAGGFNTRANKGSVDFIRLNPNGTVSKREVSIDFTNGLNEDKNPALRNNDTIIVRRSGIAKLSDAISPILNPITGVFSLFKILGL